MRNLLTCALCLAAFATVLRAENHNLSATQEQLDAIAKDFQARLGINESVVIVLVESNEYVVSVQRSSTSHDTFLIKFQKSFLSTLSEEELRAVIAHEFGHIWIFTHHPFLQTEALANEKALQLISRDNLSKVYQKVWHLEGEQGTLKDFLASVEPEPTQPTIATSSSLHPESAIPVSARTQ